jgi:hypothetical protein
VLEASAASAAAGRNYRASAQKFEAKICILICAQLWVNATNLLK